MGIQGVISVALKQLIRGTGLKVAVLTSFVTLLLIVIVWESTPRQVLLAVPVLSVLSAIFTDSSNIKSSFYALILVGASVRHIIAYSTTMGLVYAAIYVVPLLTIRFFTLTEYFILTLILFAAVILLLATYYLHAKKAFTLVTI